LRNTQDRRCLLGLLAVAALAVCLLLAGIALYQAYRELDETEESLRLYRSLYEELLLESSELNSSIQELESRCRELSLTVLELNDSLGTWKARYDALLASIESNRIGRFPVNITRLALPGADEGYELIYRAEQLDIPNLLGIEPLNVAFSGVGDFDIPRYVNDGVINYFAARHEMFIREWGARNFTRSGYLEYSATVDRFKGVITEDRGNLTVTASDGASWSETRCDWRDPGRGGPSYWYGGDSSEMLLDGFMVTMELSYDEFFSNLGGHGFELNPQYVFFSKGKELVAVLLPTGWGEWWI